MNMHKRFGMMLLSGAVVALTPPLALADAGAAAKAAADSAAAAAASAVTKDNAGSSNAQQLCIWPMRATLKQAHDKEDKEYPASVSLLFSSIAGDSDLIKITETTTVGLGKFVESYPALVQNTSEWKEFQTRLSCQNRAGDYSFGVQVVNGRLVASLGSEVEKFACTGLDVPCPTWDKPFRTCRKDASTKVWGARLLTKSEVALLTDGNNSFRAQVTNTTSSSNSSDAQNFVRDLFGGSLAGAVGVYAIRNLESNGLNTIKSEINKSFTGKSFSLGNGMKLPSFPNYEPKMIEMSFTEVSGIGPAFSVSALIRREVKEYRASTGCALAKQLGATRVSNR
jgi:hypothetical protein